MNEYSGTGRTLQVTRRVWVACVLVVLAVLLPVTGRAQFPAVVNANTRPFRLANGPDGNIYVTDPVARSVFIYDSDLSLVGEIPNAGVPLGVAVGLNGLIYVGNDQSKCIDVYQPDGTKIASHAAGALSKPNDLVFDPLNETIYVVDSGTHNIRRYNTGGNLLSVFGSHGVMPGQFDFPVSIDVAYQTNGTGDVEGELFVADKLNRRVQVFSLAGDFKRLLQADQVGQYDDSPAEQVGKVGSIQSVAVDDLYRVHVLDAFMSRVTVWDAEASPVDQLQEYGSFGQLAGQLDLAMDLLVTDPVKGTNRVIVANHMNSRVEILQEIPAVGEISLTSTTVTENAAGGTVVGTFTNTPTPTNTVAYTLVAGANSDNAFFEVNGNDLELHSSLLDREVDGATLSVRVKALGVDSRNLRFGQALTVTIQDAQENPTNVYLANASVLEGEPSGTLVGSLVMVDPDSPPGGTTNMTLVAGTGDEGNGSFSISSSNTLMTAAIFDHGAQSLYSIRVEALDATSRGVTNVLSVSIIQTNAFGEADSDGDGMDDAWELNNSGTATGLDPSDDEDGDGLNNLGEYIAGTHAHLARDVFQVEEQDFTGGATTNPIIRWYSVANRYYKIEWTDVLTNSFTELTNDLAATPPMNVYTDVLHGADSKGFYRIKVRTTAP